MKGLWILDVLHTIYVTWILARADTIKDSNITKTSSTTTPSRSTPWPRSQHAQFSDARLFQMEVTDTLIFERKLSSPVITRRITLPYLVKLPSESKIGNDNGNYVLRIKGSKNLHLQTNKTWQLVPQEVRLSICITLYHNNLGQTS